MRTFLTILLSLFLIPAASAAGPWLGVASNGLGYTLGAGDGTTQIGALTLKGVWGIPRVTMNGRVAGQSTDGHTLVLAQEGDHPNGALSKKSSFLVLSTHPLRVRQTVNLSGDFGFDALSPHGTTMYLIQHVSTENLFRYQVRAYDLAHKHLLARVIADKRQAGWLMNGYPIDRVSTSTGRWVYTFYSNPNNYPFVHALDTVTRTAVCIGIPWNWSTDQDAINGTTLSFKGGKLMIADRFALNRQTFKVTKR